VASSFALDASLSIYSFVDAIPASSPQLERPWPPLRDRRITHSRGVEPTT
jgi:hypothetical protein